MRPATFATSLAILSLLGSPALLAQQLPAARTAYEEGQALAGQKRPAEAIQRFRVVTELEPTFAPGWFALAFAARRAGRCPEAIPAYRRYAQLQPAEAEPFYGLGLCLRDTGDRSGAIAALQRFVELEHRPSGAKFVETARALVATLQAPAPPIAPASAAPATSPPAPASSRSPAADLYIQAQRLRDAGRIEEALQKFRQVAAVDPDLVQARAAWGELLIKIRRDQEAIAVFRAALARNQSYPLIWYELAFTLREVGRLGEAVDAYQRYIQLRPADPDPYYGLAKTLGKLGRTVEASRNYQTYIAMEKRPGESRWVQSAQAELAALHGAGAGGLTPAGAASTPLRDRAASQPR